MSKSEQDTQLEKLSAFLDGELSEQEQNRLVDRLVSDAGLRNQLGRYQSISAQLQQDEPARVDASAIVERVSQSILDEPTVLAPRRQRSYSGVKRLAFGAALAAAVAAVAVSVAPQLLDPGVEALPPETFAFAPRLSVPSVDATTVALGGNLVSQSAEEVAAEQPPQRWKLLEADVQTKLDKYLLEHSEFAGRLSVAHPNAHVGFISNKNAQH